jgi:phospholipid/cholesterol/gamma-HCH transport system substrate-binding protein
VKAHVKIRRDFERFVRTDSTASIKKAFAVAGDSFMEIAAGLGPPLQGRTATIVCVPSEDSLGRIEKLVSDLHGELIPVVKKAGMGLEEWTLLAAGLQKTRGELSGLFARWDHLAEGLEQGKGVAGRLLTDTAMAEEAQLLLARASQAMNQFQTMATNLNAAAMDIRTGAARLPEIADTVAGEMKDLPGLVRQTQVSMAELERLIEALQRHWLVRKYIRPHEALPRPTVFQNAKPEPKAEAPARSPKDSKR